MIRTRFAPSPTGYLHVGGLRTALFAYLSAKQKGGQFLLRIEDTDRERFVADGTENIVQSLYWSGILPDEGVRFADGAVTQTGEKGPYIQSERLDIYQKYANELLVAGQAYYCFCTTERLEELRAYQQKNKLPTGYDQHCLKEVPSETAQQRIAAGEKYVVRLKMPKEGESVFNDLVRGEVRFKNVLVDDQVLIKSDGFPTYHLAVVVDDHLMGITHVIRGEEWVSSTPKHVQLYTYFGWEPPQFAHLPLLLNPDKSKLSKRQGDVAVGDYKQKGYLPEALVNFVAFLGWNPGDDRELFTLDELVKEFSLEKVSKAGAVFNVEKLDWYNKEYLKRLSPEELLTRATPWLEQAGLLTAEQLNDPTYRNWLANALVLERERVATLAELPEAIRFLVRLPEYNKDMLVWKKGTHEASQQTLPGVRKVLEAVDVNAWKQDVLESKIKEWLTAEGVQTGNVLWPMRVALSGQEKSPGPFEIAGVLGKEEVLRRLDVAIAKLH